MKPKPDKWSGVTAPVGSILRSAQLIVDHHVSHGKLVYTSDALAEAIAKLIADDAGGFERGWRQATRERDEARELAAFAGVKLNEVLAERDEARQTVAFKSQFRSRDVIARG